MNPKSISNVLLCKKRSVNVDLFFIKENSKKSSSHYKKKRGGGKDIFHYRRSAQDPWVLASSIRGKSWINAKKIIKLYKLRMQVEEGFRDLKYGFDLRARLLKDKGKG